MESCTSHEFSACTVLFSGPKRVCTQAASEQPTGHTGLTSKAEEEGFEVYI